VTFQGLAALVDFTDVTIMRLRTLSAKLSVVLTALMFLGTARAAAADTITLMWDANPEPQVTGYIVHVGTQPGAYTQHVDVGLSTGYAFTSAVAGQQYCFAVSAYFAGPVEGSNSTEVCGFSNAPPLLAAPGNQQSMVSQATSLQLQGSDPQGQPVTYSATGLPPGLTLMASTGFISGTPTTLGTYSVTATVSDGTFTASRSFTWTISGSDVTAPVVTITGPTSATTYSTTTSSVTLSGTATDNASVTQVSWVNSRGGGGTASGTTSWSVPGIALQGGSNVLTVTARDAAGNTSTDVVTVTYSLPQTAPTLAAVPNQTSFVGQVVSLQLIGSDANNDPLTYGAQSLPPGLTIASTSGLISGTPTTAGTYSVLVGVMDAALYATRTFTWTVTAPASDTTAPVVTITSPTTTATYTATGATMPLGGTATDNIGVTQVTWSNNRGGSGTATGTTTWSVASVALQSGSNVITVTARDAAGNTAADVLTVTLNVNGAPTLTNPGTQTSSLGQSTSFQFAGSDPNGDSLTYSVTGLPPGLSLTPSNGLVAGVPLMTGIYTVAATVSDGTLTATQSFTWTINPNTSASVGTIRLTWNANTEPGMAGYIVHAGTQPGVYVQHYDVGLTTTYLFANALTGQRYCFAVSAYVTGPSEGPNSSEVCGYANSAPTLAAVSDQSSNVGQPVVLQLSGSDPEGATLTYGATGLPAGVSVASSTGLVSGTPSTAGTYSVTATVSDGLLSASQSFTWTVVAADATAPVVSITAPTSASTFATTASMITLSGTASDNVAVTQVSWVNSRGGSGVATGTTSWSVAGVTLQSGSNVLTVTARDAAGNTSTDMLTVTYNAVPVLASVASPSTEVGRAASLALSASDADGDLLTYGANGLPPGLAITVATGVISGTPTVAGTYPVTATVYDGVQSASRTFTWTVTPDVSAPTVAIAQPTAAATHTTTLASVTVAGSASDLVGVTQVTWASDRGVSGAASGTTAWSATVSLQSGVNVVTVTARDAAGNTATDVLTVTRNSTAPTPTAPTLAAVPNQSTRVGQAVSLQLVASDVNGDTLQYGALNLPPGVSISATTGRISGTPTTVGTYNVTVGVSDGTLYAVRTFTWTTRRF
jgi:hypothetical protein